MSIVFNLSATDETIYDTVNRDTVINNVGIIPQQVDMFGGNNAMYSNGGVYLTTSAPAINLGLNDFTISFWANCTVHANWIAFFGNYSNNSFTFWAYGRSGANYSLSVNTNTGDQNRTDGMIIDGTWHHYALVRNKSIITFYLDGKFKSTFSIAETQPINFNGTLGIGYAVTGYAAIYGYMSDFTIADTPLWDGEFDVPTTYLRASKKVYVDNNDTIWGATQ